MKIKALKIVIIDDNLHLRTSLEKLLTILGHTVFMASTAEAGMDLVKAHCPGLLICDISLQGAINGYGVARMRRLDTTVSIAGTYFVALSGNHQQQDREKSLQAGFDRHVAKPASLADIKDIIDHTLRHRLRRGLLA